MSDVADETGPVIAENYSIFDEKYIKGEQIGRAGQYGVTHKCQLRSRSSDAEIPDIVAVKIMSKERFRKCGEQLYRKWIGFQKAEITALMIARHENVVRLFDVMEDDESVYLVMEYLEGGELLQWMVKRGKVSEHAVANIVFQILSGLDYIHGRNILHLDLKPENIMLVNKPVEGEEDSFTPHIKLIDFGFATILPRLQKMDGRRGTPYYMAPEMLRGQYDRAVDVWATGVMTFTMLFGYLPFYDDHASNIRVIFRQIQLGFAPDVRRGCGAWFPAEIPISPDGRNFIAEMLESRVDKRATVSECLAHKWVRGRAPRDLLPEVAMRGLAQFTTSLQRRRKTTLLMSDPSLVDQLNLGAGQRERRDSMMEEYTNADGLVGKSEFLARMGSKMNSMRHLAVDTLFDELDTDHDGAISVETVKRIEAFQTLVSVDDRMLQLFEKLDVDGDGKISEDEIESAISNMQDGSTVAQLINVRSIFNESDLNGDGFIDREEFIQSIHPNFAPPTYEKTTPSVVVSRAFASPSMRQRSALYYELLRQLEDGHGAAAAAAAGGGDRATSALRPRMGKQLTIPVAMRRQPTPLQKSPSVHDAYVETYSDPSQRLRQEVERRLAEEMKQKSSGRPKADLENPIRKTKDGVSIHIGGLARRREEEREAGGPATSSSSSASGSGSGSGEFGSGSENMALKSNARGQGMQQLDSQSAATSAGTISPETSVTIEMASEERDTSGADCCVVM